MLALLPEKMLGTPIKYVLRAAVLASLGLLFYGKIADGTLSYYINPRFAWLSLLAVMLFLALAMSALWSALDARRSAAAELTDVATLNRLARRRQLGSRLSTALGVGLLLTPVMFSALAPAQPLGASAIQSRGIGRFAPDRPGAVSVAQRQPENILDWLREFARAADPAAFSGKPADVIGFVYRDPRNRANEFWVSRFVVSCCVADAAAIGLLVQSDRAAELPLDTWVRVRGRFGVTEFAGERIPLIIAEDVQVSDAPAEPYLYP